MLSPRSLILLASPLLLVTCAKLEKKFGRIESDSTKVVFTSQKELGTLSSLNGGVMIYALSSSAAINKTYVFSNEDLANGSASTNLKNGLYKFYLIGFTNSGMQGGARCGVGNGEADVNLNGLPQTISFTANASNCALPAFSPSSSASHASIGFKPLDIVSCVSGTSLGPFSETSTCAGTKGGLNHTRSIKIELVGYNLAGEAPSSSNVTSGIQSSCLRGAGLPGSNPVYTTTDTQANSVFTLDSNTMFFGLQGDGIVRNAITSGSDSFSVVLGATGVTEISGTGSNLIGGTGGGAVYSTNYGATWNYASSGLTAGAVSSVFAESATNMYAGRPTAGAFFRSTNGGVDWSQVAAQANHGITAIETIFATSSGYVYAGGSNSTNGILAYSTDNGATWTNIHSGSGDGGVWVVKVINGKLYWGTNNGLYVSSNANGSSPTIYCNSGCGNAGTLLDNIVQDVTLGEKTLYVAAPTGISVNPGANFSLWENYLSAQLGAGNLNIQGIAFNNGRLYQAVLGASDDPVRSTDSRGSGAAFPGSGNPIVPVGSSNSFLATKVTTYSDPGCQNSAQEYFYPHGLYGGTSTTALKYGAGTNNRFFIND